MNNKRKREKKKKGVWALSCGHWEASRDVSAGKKQGQMTSVNIGGFKNFSWDHSGRRMLSI
jgi:hypothetical protein